MGAIGAVKRFKSLPSMSRAFARSLALSRPAMRALVGSRRHLRSTLAMNWASRRGAGGAAALGYARHAFGLYNT